MSKNVLILCTGNSCRSQMAEVIWQHLGAENWTAYSAGSRPSGFVHPFAIKALNEIGLPTHGLNSKSVDGFLDQPIDLVVTVCDNAKGSCPTLPQSCQFLHWPFEDPAEATGTDAEKMTVFRDVRDQIRARIIEYLESGSPQTKASNTTPNESAHPVALDPPTRDDALRLIELALIEDIGSSDLELACDCTTLAVVPENVRAEASFVARQAGVVCGLQIVELAVARFAPALKITCRVNDSQVITKNQPLAELSGPARQILMLERTCLNFIGRLSGISTLTRQFVDLTANTSAKILDTRKTLPGWRRLEKYAVACGGGANHRMGLYDAILIKDNHLAMYGGFIGNHKLSITDAIRMARQWVKKNSDKLPRGARTTIQIEVDTLDQLEIALQSEPDIILLDNMSPPQLDRAARLRDATKPHVLLEASGGINLDNVSRVSKTGVERISIGALTHSAVNLDIGLDWQIDAS